MTSSVHRKKKSNLLLPFVYCPVWSGSQWVGLCFVWSVCLLGGGLKTSSEDLSRYTALALAQS